jgi:hypothetical protein
MVTVVRMALGKILYMPMKAFHRSSGPGMNIGLTSLSWVMIIQRTIKIIGTISLGIQWEYFDLNCVRLRNM